MADEATGIETAIGLPGDPDGAYQGLLATCQNSLRGLGIGVYTVAQDGTVTMRIPHRPRADALAQSGQGRPDS